ncbi:MAG: hypothetical protein H6733_05885 [Alphaproteobacteria bacterium]|nr:hypothetical protein [Alphaproteobacteria bacterium]
MTRCAARAGLVAASLGMVAGCDRRLDLVVDASDLVAAHPDATLLVVDVVVFAEVQGELVLDLSSTPTGTLVDVLDAADSNGIVAFADLDGDGGCTFEADLGWRFVYEAGFGETLTWSPDDATFRDQSACGDFAERLFP